VTPLSRCFSKLALRTVFASSSAIRLVNLLLHLTTIPPSNVNTFQLSSLLCQSPPHSCALHPGAGDIVHPACRCASRPLPSASHSFVQLDTTLSCCARAGPVSDAVVFLHSQPVGRLNLSRSTTIIELDRCCHEHSTKHRNLTRPRGGA
jgi:hypothetical protein